MKDKNASAVEEIKSRIDLAELARRYVDLRRVGARLMAPCPFHQETKPSFSVNPEMGVFYCFGCQASGDVIDFYSRINGLEFKEALAQLAEEAGVELSRGARPSPRDQEKRRSRDRFLTMYAWSARHFQDNLNGPEGEKCREYLAKRQLSSEIVSNFALGWSPPGWDDLRRFLEKKGVSPREALEAGLLSQSGKGRVFDRFRARLIFPIMNLSRHVIAFGGRVLTSEEDQPKYINSSETVLYTKGEHLYGLPQARKAITQSKIALLTEGYIDVLTLHEFGYENACGILGTSLTDKQVQRIGGFCSEVELVLDGDNAGRKAALRACEMILSRGLKCRIVTLPQDADIDDVLRKQGGDAFESMRAEALEGLDFCLREAAKLAPRDMLDWARKFIGGLALPQLKAYYPRRVADALGLSEAELRESASAESAGFAGTRREHFDLASEPETVETQGAETLTMEERDLLRFAIRYPGHLQLLEDKGALSVLSSGFGHGLWEKLRDREDDADDVALMMDEREKSFWCECQLMKEALQANEQRELDDICAYLDNYRRAKNGESVVSALRRLGGGGVEEEGRDMELLRALQESIREG